MKAILIISCHLHLGHEVAYFLLTFQPKHWCIRLFLKFHMHHLSHSPPVVHVDNTLWLWHIVQYPVTSNSMVLSSLGGTIAEAVGRQSVNAEARFHPSQNLRDLWWAKWHWNTPFLSPALYSMSVLVHQCSIVMHLSSTQYKVNNWHL
jgi:hypothetical protein